MKEKRVLKLAKFLKVILPSKAIEKIRENKRKKVERDKLFLDMLSSSDYYINPDILKIALRLCFK